MERAREVVLGRIGSAQSYGIDAEEMNFILQSYHQCLGSGKTLLNILKHYPDGLESTLLQKSDRCHMTALCSLLAQGAQLLYNLVCRLRYSLKPGFLFFFLFFFFYFWCTVTFTLLTC